MITEERIKERLHQVKYPGFSRDIVSFGLVKQVQIEGKTIRLKLEITTSDSEIPLQIKQGIEEAFRGEEGIDSVEVDIQVNEPVKAAMQAGNTDPDQNRIPGIRHIIAVASGKGGVGKSTVATNLAYALSQQGLKTGLCDCDLYGPSIGLMLGTTERPTVSEDEKINPITRFGLKLMSMSFLVDEDAPVILRGPMVTRYTQQFLRSVNWGELDVLVLDLPPGTGDIQLTIVQTVALSGAVIVSTPQEVALIDARKAVKMFEKVNVKILGLIENMSYFICPNDGNRYDIFGSEGGKREASRLKVPLLAEIPLDIATRKAGDHGEPITSRDAESPPAQGFLGAAEKLKTILS